MPEPSSQPAPKPKSKYKGIFRRLAIEVAIIFALAVLVVFVAWRMMIAMPGKSYQGTLPADAPAAGAESIAARAEALRADVAALEKIGERHLDRPEALYRAADWIEAELTAAGYAVQRQIYQVFGQDCANIEVELRGEAKPDEIVIVGAHYDTVLGTPGANDNGSGVAATLALARRFAKAKPARTLRFVAFVNEEPPYFQTDHMGSRVYARRCKERKEKVVGMLSLETIGYYDDREGSQRYPEPFQKLYPSKGNFIGFIGNLDSAELVRRVVETFRKNEDFPSEGAALPSFVAGVGFSDHWSFFEEGYPALMVTDTAMMRYPHYHEATDTADKMDFDRMARVVRGLEAAVAKISGSD